MKEEFTKEAVEQLLGKLPELEPGQKWKFWGWGEGGGLWEGNKRCFACTSCNLNWVLGDYLGSGLNYFYTEPVNALPEREGFKLEYKGKGYKGEAPHGFIYHEHHYWLWVPIAKPTTIKDLMPNGEEKVFVHRENEETFCVGVVLYKNGNVTLDHDTLDAWGEKGYRYSNNIHTKYEDAKEFVVEGGSNED